MDYSEVINFWFKELAPKDWYKKDESLDQTITKKFEKTFNKAIQGELFQWRNNIEGRLAEIILLDQFSRNMFRDTPKAFQYDFLALALSQEASIRDDVQTLPIEKKAFLYMPYMHSESLKIHDEAVKLFSEKGLENNLKFEHQHRDIIKRFGRYPHRNEILGRKSTQEEIQFLKEKDSSF